MSLQAFPYSSVRSRPLSTNNSVTTDLYGARRTRASCEDIELHKRNDSAWNFTLVHPALAVEDLLLPMSASRYPQLLWCSHVTFVSVSWAVPPV